MAMVAEFPLANMSMDQMMGYLCIDVEEEIWYTDSGASHHCTLAADNLEVKASYEEQDKVLMENGTNLAFSSIGHKNFVSNDYVFRLKNMLHVPHITKNLSSVSKFTKDNDVMFEFYFDCCFVNDKATKRVLLEGRLHNGFYAFPPPNSFHQKHKFKSIYDDALVGNKNFSSALFSNCKSDFFGSKLCKNVVDSRKTVATANKSVSVSLFSI